MTNSQKAILIFGGSQLQRSITEKSRQLGLYTIVIDPDPLALCKDIADSFYVIGGGDYDATLEIALKYRVSGVITASSDKPLVMMARIALALDLPSISVDTAILATDKLLMKECFMSNGIPCARGYDIKSSFDFAGSFPVILKPRDNSGSRGVVLCQTQDELDEYFLQAKAFTKKESVLVEEFIRGKEYSIEGIHYDGGHKVIQFTEKETTPFPYNVELGHLQPASLSQELKEKITQLIEQIGEAFNYNDCASHTELKIYNHVIYIIETSPRLGGDYITSHLTTLSSGYDMEKALLQIAIGMIPNQTIRHNKSAIIKFFNLQPDTHITGSLNTEEQDRSCHHFSFRLKKGDRVPIIRNSLDRYGEVILSSETRAEALDDYRLIFENLGLF